MALLRLLGVPARVVALIEVMAAPLTSFFEAKGRLAEGVALLSMATPMLDEDVAEARAAAATVWCSLAALSYKRDDPAAAETIARRGLRCLPSHGQHARRGGGPQQRRQHVVQRRPLRRGSPFRARAQPVRRARVAAYRGVFLLNLGLAELELRNLARDALVRESAA